MYSCYLRKKPKQATVAKKREITDAFSALLLFIYKKKSQSTRWKRNQKRVRNINGMEIRNDPDVTIKSNKWRNSGIRTQEVKNWWSKLRSSIPNPWNLSSLHRRYILLASLTVKKPWNIEKDMQLPFLFPNNLVSMLNYSLSLRTKTDICCPIEYRIPSPFT